MCGRYALKLLPEHLQEIYKVTGRLPSYPARYNVAPTQLAPVVGFNPKTGQNGLAEMKWGLVPHWADDPSIGVKMINARAETVSEKASFRESLKRKRCVVPISGFYEWKREGGEKQPYYFTQTNGLPMGLAGLWADWKGDGETLRTFTVITTGANEIVSTVHNRMPVILHPDQFEVWLDPDLPTESAVHMLKPFPADEMQMHPVSKAISRPAADGENLITAIPLNSQ